MKIINRANALILKFSNLRILIGHELILQLDNPLLSQSSQTLFPKKSGNKRNPQTEITRQIKKLLTAEQNHV